MSLLTKNTKKILIFSAATLILAMGAATPFILKNRTKAPETAGTTGTINYSPPTEEQKQDGEQRKSDIVENQAKANTEPKHGSQSVTVVITSATVDRINAYISGIFEEGGTCTATFKLGNQSFTKTTTAFANVSSTSCSPINLQRSDFPSAGSWTVTIAYNSAAADGISEPSTIEVK